MSYIEIEYNKYSGYFCNNDLILICDREICRNDIDSPFMDDKSRRYIPKVNFNDKNLFPIRINKKNLDEELYSELNSMLACREYVSKQNHFFDRKQFQQAQAEQADQEKKFQEYQKRQQEQIRIEKQKRRRQHPSYVNRFDEKRYVSSIKKKLYI